MRRLRLAPRGGQNGARPGFRAIQHGEWALGALEDRFCLPGTCVRIGGRAPTQGVHPSAMEVLGARNGQLPLGSRCLPPPSQNPMCGNRSVREPRMLAESGRAYRAAGAPPICTKPLRRRFRFFRGRRDPDIDSGLVRACFVPIWPQSRAVPTGRREGWYPANTDAHLSTTHAPGVFGVIGSSRSALGVLGIVPGGGGGTNR